MSVRVDHDVVIVGARIAGSITAALLGEAGHDVLLLDRERFPSDTRSTHFFRGAGLVAALDRVGVLADTLSFGSPRLTCEYGYDGGGSEMVVGPPQDPGAFGYCLSVRRLPLDALLVERARRLPSVQVEEGVRVIGLIHDGDRVVGVQCNRAGEELIVRARLVVGADGRHSLVAREAHAEDMIWEPPLRSLWYRYYRNLEGPRGAPDGPEFSRCGDEIAYVFPSDGGLTCVALSVPISEVAEVKARGDSPRGRYRERLAAHAGLAQRVAAATPEGRFLGCGPEPNYVRMPWGPGWALVGDASIHQDPWSGLGMDMAGVHAGFLAEAIDDWLAGKLDEDRAFTNYGDRRDAHALDGFRETVTGARDFRLIEW